MFCVTETKEKGNVVEVAMAKRLMNQTAQTHLNWPPYTCMPVHLSTWHPCTTHLGITHHYRSGFRQIILDL
jgi:hypothetical protein